MLRGVGPKCAIIPKCVHCTCRCGRPLIPFDGSSFIIVQKRGARTPAKAPSVKRNRTENDRNAYRNANANFRRYLLPKFNQFARAVDLPISAESAVEFMERVFNPPPDGGKTKTVERLRLAQKDLDLTQAEIFIIARWLIDGPSEFRDQGMYLFNILSADGHQYSTVLLVSEALLQFKRNPRAIHSKQLEASRRHLTMLADEGKDLEAMVLEGKVAYEVLGDDDRARKYWERAMRPAIALGKRLLGTVQGDAVKASFEGTDPLWNPTRYFLSSPWDELTLLHREREDAMVKNGDQNYVYERDLVKKYVDIGCELDDPLSYFRRADFFKSTQHGTIVYTSSWVHDMTRAAASLYPPAAHHLAEFYRTSIWRYIDDEPPDHLQPTPFDLQPSRARRGILGTLKSWFGQKSGVHSIKEPSEAVFFSAIFPSTALERLKLAKAWLQIPLEQFYAPSFLLAADLERQKWLYKDANVPKAALRLSRRRYGAVSSAEDLETGSRDGIPPGCFKNPLRNVDKAKEYIREVFYVVGAEDIRIAWQKTHIVYHHGESRKIHDDDDYSRYHMGDRRKGQMLPNHYKWHHNSTVYNMYRANIRKLALEAKQMCDEEGWDIFDDQDGLLYRYNRKEHAKYADAD
nr:hypothetical protein CFP56_72793 [Quercus suber]